MPHEPKSRKRLGVDLVWCYWRAVLSVQKRRCWADTALSGLAASDMMGAR